MLGHWDTNPRRLSIGSAAALALMALGVMLVIAGPRERFQGFLSTLPLPFVEGAEAQAAGGAESVAGVTAGRGVGTDTSLEELRRFRADTGHEEVAHATTRPRSGDDAVSPADEPLLPEATFIPGGGSTGPADSSVGDEPAGTETPHSDDPAGLLDVDADVRGADGETALLVEVGGGTVGVGATVGSTPDATASVEAAVNTPLADADLAATLDLDGEATPAVAVEATAETLLGTGEVSVALEPDDGASAAASVDGLLDVELGLGSGLEVTAGIAGIEVPVSTAPETGDEAPAILAPLPPVLPSEDGESSVVEDLLGGLFGS